MPSSPLLRSLRAALCALIAALVAATVALPAAARAAQANWPGNPFSPQSIWNAPLPTRVKLAAGAESLQRTLVSQVDEQGHAWIDTWDYSDPVYVVSRDQRNVHVTLDDDNRGLQAAFDAVPIPASARAALGDDEQMTVWQPSRNRMWEFWKMHREADGWHARWGGEMNRVSQNPGYFENNGSPTNWGATATGLPLLGGLITFADLRRGAIDHALALALPDTAARTWVWPAQRTDGNVRMATGAIPEGTRFRLDPHLDVDRMHLSPIARMIALAAQRYGIIVRDKGGAVTFFGQAPVGGDDPWPRALGGKTPSEELDGFPWDRLQALNAPSGCCWAPH